MATDARRSQILHWIRTGKHVIQADYEKPAGARGTVTGIDVDECSGNDDVSTGSTASSSVPDVLTGADGDVLILKSVDVARVFHEGRGTWAHFVKVAESLPPHSFPLGFLDPAVMLKDVPALPVKLPRRGALVGRPLWRVPDPEHGHDAQTEGVELQYLYGTRKHFQLSLPKPIECRFSSRPPHPEHRPSAAERSLALLTLCWSYIFSVRFLELQGRKVLYSLHSLQPKMAKTFRAKQDDVVLDLRASASLTLVRWLCAILAPKPGWLADGGDFPPWAAFCSGDASFIIVADGPVTISPNERAPTSTQATELLIELCSLYGLENRRDRQSEISPPTAAFLAALALPFYREASLQPQFPVPALRRRSTDSARFGYIRQYVDDLRYYMTLSMHLWSLGSIIWSIFWQPEIECNLVSPWLSSILSVLRPIVDSRDSEKLAKVFAFRRPRVALWWLGIFFLGDPTVLDWIVRYLETLEERWGFGSMAPPDTAVAAWTGSPQSFLDDKSRHLYRDPADPVSRADLLQHRYNFRLQDATSRPLSWRPFGYVARDVIEPDLWPWLERGHVREYVHWVWWADQGKDVVRDVQLGFRRDTGRFVEDVPDRLEIIRVSRPAGYNDDVKLAPSKESTLRMISYCMEDVSGDRDTSITAVHGARTHPWLKHWRGLE
ncbi:hypothetical protein VTK56DRAFT_7959 [Thermocarpiscus australiensis]